MRIAAYCDFYADSTRPLQLIVDARPGEMDWSKTLYIPVPVRLSRSLPKTSAICRAYLSCWKTSYGPKNRRSFPTFRSSA